MKKFTLFAAAAVLGLSASAQTFNTTKISTADALEGIEKARIDYVILDEDIVALLDKDSNYTMNSWGVDDVNTHLYVWEGTYVAGQSTEPGVDGGFGYLSMDVTNVGWSGLGYNIDAAKKFDTSHFTDATIMHIAYRTNSNPAPAAFCFGVLDPDNGKLKVGTGAADWEPTYNVVGNAPTEEWQAIELTIADFKKLNPAFNYSNVTNTNYFVLLAGGVAGQNVCIDGFYFITPGGEGAISTIDTDNSNAAPVYYNLQGVRVNNPENGIFIRKAGDKVEKVAL